MTMARAKSSAWNRDTASIVASASAAAAAACSLASSCAAAAARGAARGGPESGQEARRGFGWSEGHPGPHLQLLR